LGIVWEKSFKYQKRTAQSLIRPWDKIERDAGWGVGGNLNKGSMTLLKII